MNTMRALFSIAACAALLGCGSSEEPAAPAADAAAAAVAATAAEHEHDAPAPTPAAEAPPKVPVLEQELAYGEGARSNLVGYLAMPQDAAEPLAGHHRDPRMVGLERQHQGDDAAARRRGLCRSRRRSLRRRDGGNARGSAGADERALGRAPTRPRNNLRQAYDYLEKYALAPRIASIGWCLGGGLSLQTALQYPDALDAMVMYYGQVVTDADRLAPLNVPVLGFFGAEDESIPVRDVQGFRSNLMELGKTAEVLIVPRVDHAFANPSGGNYNEQAANEAWATHARVSRAASEARHADGGR